MPYTVLLLLSFHLMVLPPRIVQTVDGGNRRYAIQGEQFNAYTSGQSVPVLIVLQDQSSVAEKQKPAPSKKEAPAAEKKKATSPQQTQKKTPSKGFVPSEKIKADKAVDFPADI